LVAHIKAIIGRVFAFAIFSPFHSLAPFPNPLLSLHSVAELRRLKREERKLKIEERKNGEKIKNGYEYL